MLQLHGTVRMAKRRVHENMLLWWCLNAALGFNMFTNHEKIGNSSKITTPWQLMSCKMINIAKKQGQNAELLVLSVVLLPVILPVFFCLCFCIFHSSFLHVTHLLPLFGWLRVIYVIIVIVMLFSFSPQSPQLKRFFLLPGRPCK